MTALSVREKHTPGALLSRKQAALRLNVCETKLDQLLKAGTLAHIQAGRKVLITEAAIEVFIDNGGAR